MRFRLWGLGSWIVILDDLRVDFSSSYEIIWKYQLGLLLQHIKSYKLSSILSTLSLNFSTTYLNNTSDRLILPMRIENATKKYPLANRALPIYVMLVGVVDMTKWPLSRSANSSSSILVLLSSLRTYTIDWYKMDRNSLRSAQGSLCRSSSWLGCDPSTTYSYTTGFYRQDMYWAYCDCSSSDSKGSGILYSIQM